MTTLTLLGNRVSSVFPSLGQLCSLALEWLDFLSLWVSVTPHTGMKTSATDASGTSLVLSVCLAGSLVSKQGNSAAAGCVSR